MSADLLIYALVAAGLVFWLRSVLGTRHGDERQRPNPFTRQPTDPATPPAAKQPGDALVDAPVAAASSEPATHPLQLPHNLRATMAGSVVENGFMDILRQDRNFSLAHFIAGAQDAFVMIVEAFAAGDRPLLKSLLSPELYKAFEEALITRENAGETAETEIHAIRKTEIIDAKMRDRMAVVTLRFVADETAVTKNRDGTIVSGNPDRVSETIDVWTFGRDIKSKDPTWFLIATREEEAGAAPIPSL